MFDAKPQIIQCGVGDLVAQYTLDDPRMSKLDANKQGVMNESYPFMKLLGGLYYNWRRLSPCQVQVVLFDGFDYVSITQEHALDGFKIGLTNAIRTATESLGDVDPAVGEAIWEDMVNS